ncbi:DinB family protein [Flavobacterium sp. H122]|uniref:DinB family protein n=1 Tax=Flavobacterium sp. H122 TaxID=2529860 RepID=UPI0010AB0355|nr:DinB family protein [Flavobacterium sp. H122]
MLIPSLQYLFERDLNKLKEEIELYNNENNLWITDKNISNSGGNLCLHLIGNLKTYIGAELGETGYIRERDLEFSQKNTPRIDLLRAVEETKEIVLDTLTKLTEEDLHKEYTLVKNYPFKSTYHLLIHLTVHLGYHLGQINYHRRLLDN